MNKQDILNAAKQNMNLFIQQIEPENIQEMRKNIELYFHFLETLYLLDTPVQAEQSTIVEQSSRVVQNRQILGQQQPQATAVPPTTRNMPMEAAYAPHTDTNNVYVLDRKLKGGYLNGTSYKLSESVLRYEGFQHGDKIGVNIKDNKPYYYLVEKGPGIDPPQRKQISFGLIEQEGDVLVVRKDFLTDSDIRINDAPYSFVISDYDRQTLKLEAGDVVDIAYYENNLLETKKVIWKHFTEEITPRKQPESPKAKREQSATKETAVEKEESEIKPLLEGVHVLVVGADFKKEHFQLKIAYQHKGEFSWLSGSEEASRLKSKIKNADVVIFIKRFLNHPKGNLMKNYCKEFGVPFSFRLENFSPDKVVEEAYYLMNEYDISV